MTDEDTGEPEHNIGAAASERRSFPVGGPDDTRAERVVDRLGELYWRTTYGGRPAFDCFVRTILSQNTTDAASAPAHEALRERYADAGDGDDVDLAEALAAADVGTLAETVAAAGLQHRKARRIVAAAERVLADHGSAAAFDAFVRDRPPATVREHLLSYDGVGPKTADCVLLFSGGRDGVFPVDTHVHRVVRRLGVAPPDADPETVRAVLEDRVPPEKCGFGHTATIEFGRDYCTAREPACLDGPEACPLAECCDRVGVDPATETVVDPADAVETPDG
ncbi:endonuclease III [Halobacteriales archaeon SW_12_71_31]|nr:MAG: endonuclease III [Halobacteriales archaeon SW_12_71_31]